MANTSAADRSGAIGGVGADSGPPGRGAAGLSKEVHTLTSVIKQLEEQLEQMMATNETLRKDLHDERERRLAQDAKVDELHETVRRSERQIADKENLLAEVKHANQERARLTASARDLGERLKELTEQRDTEAKKNERLRAAHADALGEVHSVESQFERAMQVVTQLRSQLTILSEERDQQSLRARSNEALLGELRHERDNLVAEVEQSRAALDEIRQSLVDASISAPSGEDAEPRKTSTNAPKGAR